MIFRHGMLRTMWLKYDTNGRDASWNTRVHEKMDWGLIVRSISRVLLLVPDRKRKPRRTATAVRPTCQPSRRPPKSWTSQATATSEMLLSESTKPVLYTMILNCEEKLCRTKKIRCFIQTPNSRTLIVATLDVLHGPTMTLENFKLKNGIQSSLLREEQKTSSAIKVLEWLIAAFPLDFKIKEDMKPLQLIKTKEEVAWLNEWMFRQDLFCLSSSLT